VKLTKNLLEHKRTIQALTAFWTGLVAYLCLVSSHSLPSVNVFKFDKIGHFTFHFGITVIWFLFWKTTYKNENKFAVFGVLIEICQGLFTETRKSDIHDIFANTTGALIAVVVIYLVNKINSKPL
jgi:VanZ family protein